MGAVLFRFEQCVLDVSNRRLLKYGVPIDLNARYLDALALLVRNAGQLVEKTTLLDEVWSGVPVTDEALTQAIRVLRKQLGDDATRPTYIETVPKHGYRFIADVETVVAEMPTRERQSNPIARPARGVGGFDLWRAGTLGAVAAGLIGGLIYGLAEASAPIGTGTAGISVVLVYLCLTTTIAFLGGAGVTFGIVSSTAARPFHLLYMVWGGALGGLLVGAMVKLIGVDALGLLFGNAPHDITGPLEGALLGAAVGVGAALSYSQRSSPSLRRSVIVAALISGAAGALIPLLGGRMMAGSLVLLADTFPNSRLNLGAIGRVLGEDGLGTATQVVTGALEGMLFGGCIVAALASAWGAPRFARKAVGNRSMHRG